MPPTESRDPTVLVVMGVSGSGKSTIGALVAQRLGWRFADGDAFHTAAHIDKMRGGHALDDADRTPWLALLRQWIEARLEAGESGVLVCSALKRAYRDALVGGHGRVRVVYLSGSREVIAARLAARHGHFMPSALLDSQFAVLEPPGANERPIVVDIAAAPDAIAARVAAAVDGGKA